MRTRTVLPFAILAPALALAIVPALGCERPPSADVLPEWSPADHHSNDDDKLAAAAQAPPQRAQPPKPAAPADGPVRAGTDGAAEVEHGGGGGPGATSNAAALVDLTWRQQCTTCHGPAGRGDGQMSAMFRVPDLTQEGWQSSVSDAQIASTIKNGKGKMPNFDVPDEVVQGLVARVRAVRGR